MIQAPPEKEIKKLTPKAMAQRRATTTAQTGQGNAEKIEQKYHTLTEADWMAFTNAYRNNTENDARLDLENLEIKKPKKERVEHPQFSDEQKKAICCQTVQAVALLRELAFGKDNDGRDLTLDAFIKNHMPDDKLAFTENVGIKAAKANLSAAITKFTDYNKTHPDVTLGRFLKQRFSSLPKDLLKRMVSTEKNFFSAPPCSASAPLQQLTETMQHIGDFLGAYSVKDETRPFVTAITWRLQNKLFDHIKAHGHYDPQQKTVVRGDGVKEREEKHREAQEAFLGRPDSKLLVDCLYRRCRPITCEQVKTAFIEFKKNHGNATPPLDVFYEAAHRKWLRSISSFDTAHATLLTTHYESFLKENIIRMVEEDQFGVANSENTSKSFNEAQRQAKAPRIGDPIKGDVDGERTIGDNLADRSPGPVEKVMMYEPDDHIAQVFAKLRRRKPVLSVVAKLIAGYQLDEGDRTYLNGKGNFVENGRAYNQMEIAGIFGVTHQQVNLHLKTIRKIFKQHYENLVEEGGTFAERVKGVDSTGSHRGRN